MKALQAIVLSLALTLGAGGNTWAQKPPEAAPALAALTPAEAVRQAEAAFANTLRQRQLARFAEFVSQEAVFFNGPHNLHGRAAVVQAWAGFFNGPQAPFSWAPETVEVLASGTLALSSGPVFDAQGKQIAIFNSIWRLEADGVWRVVFDKGADLCACKTP